MNDGSSSSPRSSSYWFPAKRFGWGWGLPARWQGWVTLVAWLAVIAAGPALLVPMGPAVVALFIGLMGALLVMICYWKGEPPRWR